MTQVLEELELQVESCHEIFQAVEKLTSSRFEVVVADFDADLEASFLLKTAGELKSSGGPCRVAIVKSEESSVAAGRMGAIVLQKPVVLEQAKYILLSSDELLRRMSKWMPQTAAPQNVAMRPEPTKDRGAGVVDGIEPALCRVDSPELLKANTASSRRLSLPEHSIFEDPRIQTLFQAPRYRTTRKMRSWRRPACIVVFVGAFLASVGYIFSQPLRTEGVKTSVTRICRQAVQRTKTWLHRPSRMAEPELEEAHASDAEPLPAPPIPILHVGPAHRRTAPSFTMPDEP